MSAEHFRELLGVVCMTKGVAQNEIADVLNVSTESVKVWKRTGVPKTRAVRVSNIFRELCRG